jgi:hypothetical protein
MMNLLAMVAPALGFGGLVHVILGLAVCGFLCWLIVTYIPMPEVIRNIIIAVIAFAAIYWACNYFGVFN